MGKGQTPEEPAEVATPAAAETPGGAPDKGAKTDAENTNPAWLPERLKQAQTSAVNKLLKDLDLPDPKSLAEFVKKARDSEKEKLSAEERLKADLAEMQKKADAALLEADSLKRAHEASIIETAISNAARDAQAQNPDDVVMRLRSAGALEAAKLLDDNGKVKADALKPLIDQVKKDRPTWFARAGIGIPSSAGGRPAEPADRAKADPNRRRIVNL